MSDSTRTALPGQQKARNGLQNWRARYENAGYATLPLWPHRKSAFVDDWQHLPPGDLWREADRRFDGSFRGNIGLRAGAGFVFVDCDDKNNPHTTETVLSHLEALGYAPRVETPNHGTHLHLICNDAPAGFSVGLLHPDAGTGEIRARNSYVVAPCSALEDGRYRFIQGGPETIRNVKSIRWADLAPLLRPQRAPVELTAPPVRLPRLELPSRAMWLLSVLAVASPGNQIAAKWRDQPYASRSEAEAAIVAFAILRGWPYEEIARLFERYQPGHYASRGNQRENYLQTTYRNVLNELAAVPERQQLAGLYQTAQAKAWPGRAGHSQQLAYLGLLALGWRIGALEVGASLRDLELYGALGRSAAGRAIQALAGEALIKRLEGKDWHTGRYELIDHGARVDANLTETDYAPGALEVWSAGKLTRSARAVLAHLTDNPQTVAMLARATGKHRDTVRAALKTLERYGMAANDGRRWKRTADHAHRLTVTARNLEASTAARNRALAVELQRAAYHAQNPDSADPAKNRPCTDPPAAKPTGDPAKRTAQPPNRNTVTECPTIRHFSPNSSASEACVQSEKTEAVPQVMQAAIAPEIAPQTALEANSGRPKTAIEFLEYKRRASLPPVWCGQCGTMGMGGQSAAAVCPQCGEKTIWLDRPPRRRPGA